MHPRLFYIEKTIENLPNHYRQIINYLFGYGQECLIKIQRLILKLKENNAILVASKLLYKSGDYDKDSNHQNNIFKILKNGPVPKTILDSDFSILKKEVEVAFRLPTFLERCNDLGLNTPKKFTNFLLGFDGAIDSKAFVPMRNLFVQIHIGKILLLIAHNSYIYISKENKKVLRSLKKLITFYEIKIIFLEFWSKYKYVLVLIFGYFIYAWGGSQTGSLLSEPHIYMPFNSPNESVLSSTQKINFKLELSLVFILMGFLLFDNKFQYFINHSKLNHISKIKLKKIANIFYIYLLFTISSPVIAFVSDLLGKSNASELEVAILNKEWDKAYKIAGIEYKWSEEQLFFVNAQILIHQRYDLPQDEYQVNLKKYSNYVLEEFKHGRLSDHYGQSYAIKRILDANNVENNIISYDTHRLILLFWIGCLFYIFISTFKQANYLKSKKITS